MFTDCQRRIASVSVRDKLGRTALIYAVFGNLVKCLKALLKTGANVNEVDINRRSALHWAALKNHVDCTRLLLLAGAKCDLQDDEGATPLHLATEHENSKCLQLIVKHLDSESDCIIDNDKRTALHWSACSAQVDNFGLLLKRFNRMITMRDVAGKTALHWAASSTKLEAVNCIQLFFAQEVGAGVVNVSDYEGRTALHCAVIDGIYPVVKELISLPTCNVNVKDNLESTPLHWATILGKRDIIDLLLDHGASVAVHDIEGATPWHYAVQKDSLEILSAYMTRLADPDQKDQNGCTPLMWAASKAANRAITRLFEFGANLHAKDIQDYTALHVAAFCGHSTTLEKLLDLGASASDVDIQGKTAIFLACEMGHLEAARILLRRGGSDVNRVVDGSWLTCLHGAASNGHINTCQLLIENGFDPNAADFAGRSPVLYATFHGYIDCMSVLKENGGNPELCDNEGWTALHYACKQGHYDAVKLLLDWNVSLNPKAHSGERFTPLDLATINVHLDVGKFLYKKGGVSITHIKQMAAIIIQAAYKGYRVRKRCKLTPLRTRSTESAKRNVQSVNNYADHDKCKTRDGESSNDGFNLNIPRKTHRRLEKRLSRSVENLLLNIVEDEAGQFRSATSDDNQPQAGPFRLRRKKFHKCARSELTIKCSSNSGAVVAELLRPRLKSADNEFTSKGRGHFVGDKLMKKKEMIESKSADANYPEEPETLKGNFVALEENSSDSPPSSSVPSWCFDPKLRRVAERNWSDTLANIAFKRVPMNFGVDLHSSSE